MFPLNRMVGREFVPDEDMGEWIVHLDAPEGTSLEGSTEVAFKLLKAVSGIEGVAHIEPSIGVSGGSGAATHVHLLCQAKPIGDRTNTQEEMVDEMRRRLAAFPGYRPSVTSRNALGSGEGTGGFAISANILGPRPRADCRVFEARPCWRLRSSRASPMSKSTSACPIRRFMSPWIAGAPPILACGWRPSATPCDWRYPATIRSRSTRNRPSSIRSRCACSKNSGATSRKSAG